MYKILDVGEYLCNEENLTLYLHTSANHEPKKHQRPPLNIFKWYKFSHLHLSLAYSAIVPSLDRC